MNCPVCYSRSLNKYYELSAQDAAQHFVLREYDPERYCKLESHIRELWGGPLCTVRRCNACSFVFSDPYVAGDREFYNLAYHRSTYPDEKWEYRRTVEELRSSGFRARRVLEAGSGFGLFLDKIADQFVPRAGITALEYSDQAVRVLRSKNYAVRQQDVRDAGLIGEFDGVFLFQVLEHMDHVDDLFARLGQLLRKDGQLFVAVPNARRLQFNEDNGSLLDCPPNHIGRWSADALRLIGSRHGLRLDQHEIEPFSLAEFIKEDIAYAYLRRSQQRGTLSNWSRARGGTWTRRLVALLSAPRRLGVWRKAVGSGADLGGSLWAKFSKA